MTPSTETWLSQRLREGANTLSVPSDLTEEVVGKLAQPKESPRPARCGSQAAAVVTVVALVGSRRQVLRSDQESAQPPVADPTPLSATVVSDASRSLCWGHGSWRLGRGAATADPPTRIGLLVTFETDGTWNGYDGCNDLDGTYRVEPDGAFEFTTKGTTLVLCRREDPLLLLGVCSSAGDGSGSSSTTLKVTVSQRTSDPEVVAAGATGHGG